MQITDLWTLKCWLALLMVYLERRERQQDDKFVWHSGDIVWLDAPQEEGLTL